MGEELVVFPGTRLGGAKFKEASPTPKHFEVQGPHATASGVWEVEVGKERGGEVGCGRGRLAIHPAPPYQRVEGGGL